MRLILKQFAALYSILFCLQGCLSAQPQFSKQTTNSDIPSQVASDTEIQTEKPTFVDGTTNAQEPSVPDLATTSVAPETDPPTTSKRHDLKPLSKKVPNPEAGVYIVVIFLVVVGIAIISFLIFVIVREKRRRTYRDPSRDNLRGTPHSTDFDNPIQFPSSPYHSAVI